MPLFVEVLCLSLFWYALLCVLSSFAIILKGKRAGCFAAVFADVFLLLNVMWLLLSVPRVGLQCVIVVFSDL